MNDVLRRRIWIVGLRNVGLIVPGQNQHKACSHGAIQYQPEGVPLKSRAIAKIKLALHV